MAATESAVKPEIERVLQSHALRSSPNLRRLFRYLAEKSLNGAGADLKEYSIGLEAFSKPPHYDPRHDSTVRIQAGRLRLKLAEYYATEGAGDPVHIELPKGHFEMKFEPRENAVTGLPLGPTDDLAGIPAASGHLRKLIPALVLLLFAVWATALSVALWRERRQSSQFRAGWTPELQILWSPFLATDRPLLISASAPLFIRLPGIGFFRDLSLNRPEDVSESRTADAVSKALGERDTQVSNYYTPFDEANVTFMLGKVLATRRSNVSIVRSSDLTWEQLSHNNVVFTGSPKLFSDQLGSMPAKLELVFDQLSGIKNLAPRAGEPAVFSDEVNGAEAAGTTFVLVSHAPGPLGTGDIESFASRVSEGRLAAVQFFTEPATARLLVSKLRTASGEIPRYFQVVLRVEFRNATPVTTSYVLHRQLRRQEPLPK